MTMEPKHSTIAAALAAAQSEMGVAVKDSVNPAFKTRYADLSSVFAACLPALNRHGIALIQPTGEDDSGRFVATILLHTSGEKLECRVPLIVAKNDMQGYGSAVTYARRYGAMAMTCVAPDDDDGNAAAKAPPRAVDRADPRPVATSAVTDACDYLNAAEGLDDLTHRWKNLPADVQKSPAVVDAAKKTKALMIAVPPAPANADLGGDAIPY